MPDLPIVAYILTRDEEHHIEAAVSSLRQITDTIVVVDSMSGDRTCERAREAGAVVWERAFDTFSRQRNWALERIVSTFGPRWVVQLDADERVSNALATEIRQVVEGDQFDAFLIPLRLKFDGKVLRFGGFGNTRLLRLYRPDAGRYEHRDVNEHFALRSSARIRELRNPILHEDVSSWTRHIEKHNRYSSLEAAARLRRVRSGERATTLKTALRRRHLRRRWLREQIWDRLPARPAIRFVQLYVLAAGFLDGRPGFRIALFNAWQEMCTDLKYDELRRGGPDSTA